ncbi:cytosolic protein [Oceanobacillus saliphilus]|uniref:cytosolic protein n=1 Tax=Oceanobacillus saliphilus TaxID=2925834 RepID=UPI00201D2CD8|nr:cytosolic protein [Oceanobacillus saliphilus]
MSFGDTLKKYFNNHAETGEKHWDSSLKTHYYKCSKEKALAMLENYFSNSAEFAINSMSAEHGEISAISKKGKKTFVVATVIMVRPFHTAVDFSVTTESILPFDFGYSAKLINRIYSQVNKELPLIKDNHM